MKLVTQGKAYDLGLPYDRNSYKWPGHSPGEIISFRSPAGVRTQKDLPFTTPEGGNAGGTAWHSNAIFMSDNVATQIDGLGHITHGPNNEFYNGFKASEWGGDFGLRKADVTTIPPIIARAVMVDVAGFKNLEALPSSYEITREDIEGALRAQNVDVTPGTIVLLRTGTARYWGANGQDHTKIGQHDLAGIGLTAAKWLVEEKGALALGSDTSGLEYVPPKPADSQAMDGVSIQSMSTCSFSKACTSWSSTIWSDLQRTACSNSPTSRRRTPSEAQSPAQRCGLLRFDRC